MWILRLSVREEDIEEVLKLLKSSAISFRNLSYVGSDVSIYIPTTDVIKSLEIVKMLKSNFKGHLMNTIFEEPEKAIGVRS